MIIHALSIFCDIMYTHNGGIMQKDERFPPESRCTRINNKHPHTGARLFRRVCHLQPSRRHHRGPRWAEGICRETSVWRVNFLDPHDIPVLYTGVRVSMVFTYNSMHCMGVRYNSPSGLIGSWVWLKHNQWMP